jgi:hypothetical protein
MYALLVIVLFVSVLALLLIPSISPSQVFADDSDGEYYRVRTTVVDGTSIDEVIINGPPTPPPGYERTTVELPEPNLAAGLNVLANVPAFNWSFGCSATSAAMIAGYYDRTGYDNMYTGPTNGGVMLLDNSYWSDWYDGSAWRHQCPLSATHNGLDGRATNGHVDDYWIAYGSTAQDPFIGNWTEHTYGDCTGDYMKTNQSTYGNNDGSTTFYNYTNGAPLYDYEMEGYGIDDIDGGYGLKLFYESRGYTVNTAYNQYIYGYEGNTQGFTYTQYKAEIDAGRPVMIHIEGHTMVGIGYDDTSNSIYIHDTWDYNTYTMNWGGTYSGMEHYGVTIIQLQSVGAQNWYLNNDDTMYKGDTSNGEESVAIGASGFKVWIADQAATVDVSFPAAAWTGQVVFTSAPSDTHTFTIDIGSADADGSDFQEGGPTATLTGDGSATVFTFTTDATSLNVPGTKYLALRITNNSGSGYTVTTGVAWSYISSPSSDPGYPVPELSSIILLGSGLIILVGYFVWHRRKRSYECA